MDVQNTSGGSLQISTDVLVKIARLAALEVGGVAEITSGNSQNVRGLLGRTGLSKPVSVEMEDGVAAVTVHLSAAYGQKIMPLCERDHRIPRQCDRRRSGAAGSTGLKKRGTENQIWGKS